jgi:hypothetical protein
VTFKELQKLVQSQSGQEQSQLSQRLRDKPFWMWDQTIHKQEDIKTKGDCCFNHIMGLPIKDKIEKPLFGYEKLLNDSFISLDFQNPLQHKFKQTSMDQEGNWFRSYRILSAIYGLASSTKQ